MQRRVHLVIFGRVQGVWFRGSTAKVAGALGINGWVRNLLDGTVEVRAEGPAPKVEEFIAWCRIGPPRSSVERVELREETPANEFSSFEVLRR